MADTEIHKDNITKQFMPETIGFVINRAFGVPDYLLRYSYPNSQEDIKSEVVVENRKATVTVIISLS